MSTCSRCQKPIFAAENPVDIPGGKYHNACFKCKACSTQLTLKTVTTKDGSVWCKSHVPVDSPTSGIDVTMGAQMSAPKPLHGARTIAEKAGGQGSTYDHHAVAVQAALAAPVPASTVGNVNRMEQLHNGVERHTGTTDAQ